MPDHHNVVGSTNEIKGLPKPIPDATNLRAQTGREGGAGGRAYKRYTTIRVGAGLAFGATQGKNLPAHVRDACTR